MQMYTPLYGTMLARPSAAGTTIGGRLLGVAVWFGSFALIARLATPRNRARVFIYGCSTASLVFVTRVAATLTADVLATASACLALALVMKRGRLTLLASWLLLIGALLKPNVIGVLLGIALADASLRLWSWRSWLAILGIGSAAVLALQCASDGIWFFALRMTTQNEFSVHRWKNFLVEYGWFLGAPQLAIAIFVGRKRWRDPHMRYGLVAVVTSVAWQFIATGRHGSATNYWVEPLMATAVLFAAEPPARLDHAVLSRLVAIGYPLFVAVVSAVPAWRQSRAWPEARQTVSQLVTEIEALCPRDESSSWTSTLQELELQGTGKIAVFEFGLRYTIRRGELAIDELRGLLRSRAHICFVHDKDLRTPIELTDPAGETSLFDQELREEIVSNYEMIPLRAEVFVYRQRHAITSR